MPTPWKAIRFNRTKSLLIYASVVVAVSAAFLITAISQGIVGMYSAMLQSDGDIIVTQRGAADTFFSEVDAGLAPELAKLPGVVAASALLVGASPIEDLPIAGVYGMEASRISNYRIERGRRPQDGEVMLGRLLDTILDQPEAVTIGTRSFAVSGAFRSGIGFEDGGAILPLTDAAALFDKSASMILVRVPPDADAARVSAAIEAFDSTVEAQPTDRFVDHYNQFRILRVTGRVLAAIALTMGVLGVLTVMILVVNDRRDEFGIMRAIGIPQSRIALSLAAESLTVTVGAFLTAWGVSFASLELIDRAEGLRGYVHGEITPQVFLLVLGSTIAMSLLGTLFPAVIAARTDPILLIQRGSS